MTTSGAVETQQFELPGRYSATSRLSQTAMALKHVLEPFIQQHAQRLAQPIQKIGRWCVGEKTVVVGIKHVLPVPVSPWQVCV